jgi:hypothetical protein
MHPRWTVRPLDLGRTAVDLLAELGARISLEVYDGGGFTHSHGVWRVEGKLWAVVEAGRS